MKRNLLNQQTLKRYRSGFTTSVKQFKDRIKSMREMREKKKRENEDIVGLSSNILRVSEFKFFQLSYYGWYGHKLADREMEYFFTEYIFDDIMPHWVRHTARKVTSCYFQGTLDPRKFNITHPVTHGYTKEDPTANTILMIIIHVALFLIIMAV